jgi:RNA polymerase sporulation-specific sigma factor
VLTLSLAAWLLGIAGVLSGTVLLFGYLNHQVFPQPLSLEEEQTCLAAWNQGDTSARDRLIEHNLRLVAYVVKKYENSGESMEDLISIGAVGLIKAVDTFNRQHGFKLATYASRCIDNEVLMHLRNLKRAQKEVSIFEPIGYDKEGNEVALIDVLTVDEEIVDTIDHKLQSEYVRDHLQILSPRERTVLTMRYGVYNDVRETQQDIARILGISRSYVSRIESRALHKMRDRLLSASAGGAWSELN